MKLGIIGNGFVGKATFQLECDDVRIIAYDKNPDACIPLGTQITDLLECKIVFVCVPTPMRESGECYLGIIESVLKDLKAINYDGYVVLRSTVPAGTSERYKCFFMPEFLTEANFVNDFIANPNWIFGIPEDTLRDTIDDFKRTIQYTFTTSKQHNKIAHDTCTFVTTKEAESIKLFRNCFLATKVGFCNEFEEFCSGNNIDYTSVVNIAAQDKRIGMSHTMVPGPDGKRGFGGTCFPKDMNSLKHQMNGTEACEPMIISAAINRNVTRDRAEQDWNSNEGRAVINLQDIDN